MAVLSIRRVAVAAFFLSLGGQHQPQQQQRSQPFMATALVVPHVTTTRTTTTTTKATSRTVLFADNSNTNGASSSAPNNGEEGFVADNGGMPPPPSSEQPQAQQQRSVVPPPLAMSPNDGLHNQLQSLSSTSERSRLASSASASLAADIFMSRTAPVQTTTPQPQQAQPATPKVVMTAVQQAALAQKPPPLATTPNAGLQDQLHGLSSQFARPANTVGAAVAASVVGGGSDPTTTTTAGANGAGTTATTSSKTPMQPPLALSPNDGLYNQLSTLSSKNGRIAPTYAASVAASLVTPPSLRPKQPPPPPPQPQQAQQVQPEQQAQTQTQAPVETQSPPSPPSSRRSQGAFGVDVPFEYAQLQSFSEQNPAAAVSKTGTMVDRKYTPPPLSARFDQTRPFMKRLTTDSIFPGQTAAAKAASSPGIDEPFVYKQQLSPPQQNPGNVQSSSATPTTPTRATAATATGSSPSSPSSAAGGVAFGVDVPFEYAQLQSRPEQNPGAAVAKTPQDGGVGGVDRKYTPPPLYAMHDQTRLAMNRITPAGIFPGQTAAAAAQQANLDVPFEYKQTAMSQPQVNPARVKYVRPMAVSGTEQPSTTTDSTPGTTEENAASGQNTEINDATQEELTSEQEQPLGDSTPNPPQSQVESTNGSSGGSPPKPLFQVDEPFQYKGTFTAPEQNPADSRPAGVPRTQTIQTTTRHVPPPLTPFNNDSYFQPRLTKIPVEALGSNASPKKPQPGLDVPFQYKQTAMSPPIVNPAKAVQPIKKNPKLPASVAHAARAAVTTREESSEGSFSQVPPGLTEPPPPTKLTTPQQSTMMTNGSNGSALEDEPKIGGMKPGLHEPAPAKGYTQRDLFSNSDSGGTTTKQTAAGNFIQPGLHGPAPAKGYSQRSLFGLGDSQSSEPAEPKTAGNFINPGLHEPAPGKSYTQRDLVGLADSDSVVQEEKTGGIQPGLIEPPVKKLTRLTTSTEDDTQDSTKTGGIKPGLHEPKGQGTKRVYLGPTLDPLDNPSGVIQVGMKGQVRKGAPRPPPDLNAPPPSTVWNAGGATNGARTVESEETSTPSETAPSTVDSNIKPYGKGVEPLTKVSSTASSSLPDGALPGADQVPLERPSGIMSVGPPPSKSPKRLKVATPRKKKSPPSAEKAETKDSTNGMELTSSKLKAGQDDHLPKPRPKAKKPLVFFHDTRKMVSEAKEEPLTQPIEYPRKDDEPEDDSIRKPTDTADDSTVNFYKRTPRPEEE